MLADVDAGAPVQRSTANGGTAFRRRRIVFDAICAYGLEGLRVGLLWPASGYGATRKEGGWHRFMCERTPADALSDRKWKRSTEFFLSSQSKNMQTARELMEEGREIGLNNWNVSILSKIGLNRNKLISRRKS